MTAIGQHRTRLLLVVIACFALVAFAACGEEEEEAGTTVSETLEAYDFYFEDTTLLADLGARVELTFQNNGSAAHSFTVPDLDIDAEVEGAETSQIEFDVPEEPGALDFYCKFHPDQMKGILSIGGGEAPLEEDVDTEDDEDVDVNDQDTTTTTTTGDTTTTDDATGY